MPLAKTGINDFLSQMRTRNFAKPARFEVVITPPPCLLNYKVNEALSNRESGGRYTTQHTLGAMLPKRISLFCKQASIPGSRLITSRQQIFGPPSYHPISADYGGESFSLTFYIDMWYTVREFFDIWMDGIVDRESGCVNYQDNYLCQGMSVTQLDEADRAHYTAKFEDAYPIAINPTQLDYGMTNQVSEMTVTFTYRRWRSISQTTAEKPAFTRSQAERGKPPPKAPATRSSSEQLRGVTFTGIQTGTANDDSAFGVGQLSG
jgi:hypothetical protein